MTLSQRFLWFLAPIVILIGAWNSVANWLNYQNEVQFIAEKAMQTDIQELQIVAKDPIFQNYLQHKASGYENYAQKELQEMRFIFRALMENATKYGRLPDHIVLFSPQWEILTMETDNKEQEKEVTLEYQNIHNEPFYTQFQNFSAPYSWLDHDHHKTVVAIGQDQNQNNRLDQEEVQLFLHSEFLLPLAEFRDEAFRQMINNLWMALGQMIILILALGWVGRSLPKPLQEFTSHIATIAQGNFDQPLPHDWKIKELTLLTQALNRMKAELKQRETNLIEARNQEAESKIMLRQVLDTIPVHVFWKDPDFRYIGCNQRFAELAGLQNPEEILNVCDRDMIWTDQAATIQNKDRQVMSTGKSYLNYLEYLITPDGTKRCLETSKVPLTDPDDNIIGVLGVSHDVTERQRMEEELKFSRFSVMNATDAIFWINAQAHFIDCNKQGFQSLGYSRDELLNLSLHDIVPEIIPTKWPKLWTEMTTKHTIVFTSTMQRKDLSLFPVEISINILEYHGTSFAMASVNDITERRQAEQELQAYADKLEEMVQSRTKQLIHAERLATLGTFSAGMAHEINNPNAFITANVQFLQQFWQLAQPILAEHGHQDPSGRITRFHPDIDNTLNGILDGSARISKIVDSLKAYSKGGMETDRVECRLEDPVRDAQNLLQHRIKQNNVALLVEIDRNLMIYCDRQQMAQVFVNLFTNAMDALEEMQEQPEKRVTVVGKQIERHIWVWVKDNGPGIPDSAIGKVFDPFFTSKGKTKGTGLGLSIVEGIIKDHHGQITLFSNPGDETEVVIILPSIELYQEQLIRRKKNHR